MQLEPGLEVTAAAGCKAVMRVPGAENAGDEHRGRSRYHSDQPGPVLTLVIAKSVGHRQHAQARCVAALHGSLHLWSLPMPAAHHCSVDHKLHQPMPGHCRTVSESSVWNVLSIRASYVLPDATGVPWRCWPWKFLKV